MPYVHSAARSINIINIIESLSVAFSNCNSFSHSPKQGVKRRTQDLAFPHMLLLFYYRRIYPKRIHIFLRAQKLYINDVILHVSFCRLLFIVLRDYGFEIYPLSRHLEIGCINFNYSMTFQKFILLQLIFYLPIDGQLMFGRLFFSQLFASSVVKSIFLYVSCRDEMLSQR